MTILILNGPNLNMLGRREPEIYGHTTLEELRGVCLEKAAQLGLQADFRQSNHEGVLIDWIHEAADTKDLKGVIINAGAYTHTSVALHDALKILRVPVIEVHISNPKEREAFRHVSYIEPVAVKSILGQGINGYIMALEELSSL